jgi:long-chain acyl-CoA synthetase
MTEPATSISFAGLPDPWGVRIPRMRDEVHFGDRVLRCFADRPANLNEMLRTAVTMARWEDALIAGSQRISYVELEQIVGNVAANLAELGVGKGDRVALLLGNVLEFVYSIFALSRLGAISVPLGTRQRAPELEYALNDSGATVLICGVEFLPNLPDLAGLSALQHVFTVGALAPRFRHFSELLLSARPASDVAIAEEDAAVILYTSGTTGRPKGAMLTHLGIIHSTMHFETCWGIRRGDRSVLAVPASHVTGLVAIIAAMVRVGGCTILMPEFKARSFLEVAARQRLSYALLVPAMYNLCLLDPAFDSFDLSSWRVAGYGGAPMPEATISTLARKLPRLMLMNGYGATETTSPATMMPVGGTRMRPDSIGLPAPCSDVRIMGEDGREAPRGESGEIWIRGPQVVPGYWNNPEATADNFTGGYWRSGDLGSMDEEGFLRIFDRKKDMINRAGYKVYSAEVENALSHHPSVLECAVVGRPDPVLGERVHAFVVPKRADCDATVLKAFCAERMADYKVPDFFTITNEPLPRNPNGKVVKTVLRERVRLLEGVGR